MKSWLKLLVVGAALVPMVASAASWWNKDWKYRKEISFDLSPTGADIAASTQDDLVLVRIQASHFLWRMVRRIVGVLVKLGKGDITLEHFETLLQGEADPALNVSGWTAPASGLFLEKVNYAAPAASIPKKRK